MQVADPPSARVLELDALRGVAVIGIVWMNVYIFALPPQAYYNPLAWGGDQPVDQWVWATSFVFVEDKFRTLFAMLFGTGCAILLDKQDERKWRAHFARMAVLFVIGVVHATLLASNDVLRAYAMAGLALPFIAHLSARALIAISIGLLEPVVQTLFYVLHEKLWGGNLRDEHAERNRLTGRAGPLNTAASALPA